MYSVKNASEASLLADEMLAPVANSGRRTMIPTLAVQFHIAHLSEHAIRFAEAMSESMKGSIGSQTDYPLALEKAVLKYILHSYYAEVQSKVPLMSSPADIASLLDSRAPMHEIETKDDFAFFKTVHLPELTAINDRIKQLEGQVDMLRGLRYIPSFSALDLSKDMERLVGRRGFKKAGETFVTRLTSNSPLSDEQNSRLNDVVQRVMAELEQAGKNRTNMNLWELIVLVDRVANEESSIPMFINPNVHAMMAQSAFAVLPLEASRQMLLVRAPMQASGDYDNAPEAAEGLQSDKDMSDKLNYDLSGSNDVIAMSLSEVIIHAAVRSIAGSVLTLNDITLPLSGHPFYTILNSMFQDGQDLFLPKIESEFFAEWLKLAEMGSKSPLKTDDVRVKLDNAMLRDRNNIPKQFITDLEETITKKLPDMIEKYMEKRTVYRSYLQAPADRTIFRNNASVDTIRRSEAVRIESDLPFIVHERLPIAKPASSDEAYVMANKLDNETIVDGQSAAPAAALIAQLFKHKKPRDNSASLTFNHKSVLMRIKRDLNDPNMTPELNNASKMQLRLSEIVNGGTFDYRDDMSLFEERSHDNVMAMPRSYVHLMSRTVAHHYPDSSVSFGTVRGQLALGLNTRWADAIAAIATQINRVYSTMSFGQVVQEPTIIEEYRAKSYLARKTDFNSYFIKFDLLNNPRVSRFLTSFHTEKMLREKIDLETMDKLHKMELYINQALATDVLAYSEAIAKSINANFSYNSEGMQIFRDFVTGDLSERDLVKLKDPGVVAVFSTLMSMVFDQLDKKDTVMTLIIIETLLKNIDDEANANE